MLNESNIGNGMFDINSPEMIETAHAFEIESAIREMMKLRGIGEAELAEMMDVPPARMALMIKTTPSTDLMTLAWFESALGFRFNYIPCPVL